MQTLRGYWYIVLEQFTHGGLLHPQKSAKFVDKPAKIQEGNLRGGIWQCLAGVSGGHCWAVAVPLLGAAW